MPDQDDSPAFPPGYAWATAVMVLGVFAMACTTLVLLEIFFQPIAVAVAGKTTDFKFSLVAEMSLVLNGVLIPSLVGSEISRRKTKRLMRTAEESKATKRPKSTKKSKSR